MAKRTTNSNPEVRSLKSNTSNSTLKEKFMSRESRMSAGILLAVLPSVMYGGISLLQFLTRNVSGYTDNPLRHDLWRAGHAPVCRRSDPSSLLEMDCPNRSADRRDPDPYSIFSLRCVPFRDGAKRVDKFGVCGSLISGRLRFEPGNWPNSRGPAHGSLN